MSSPHSDDTRPGSRSSEQPQSREANSRPATAARCPHCDEPLPPPIPPATRLLACPACAGSLRPKHLKAGCLTSAPKLIVFAGALGWLAHVFWRALADGA